MFNHLIEVKKQTPVINDKIIKRKERKKSVTSFNINIKEILNNEILFLSEYNIKCINYSRVSFNSSQSIIFQVYNLFP